MSKPRNNEKDFKNKRSTLGQPSEISFNDDADRVTLSNVITTQKFITKPSGAMLQAGASCMHGTVELHTLVRNSVPLVRGKLTELIGGLLSQIGYQPDSAQVEDTLDDVSQIIENSLKAHALLLKMHQIQNGRQYQDVNQQMMGTLFFSNMETSIDSGDSTTELETAFDDNVSNAVWMQEYVTKLQQTYTTAVGRAFVEAMFSPIFVLSAGVSPKTSYMNLWPTTANPKSSDLKTQFNDMVSAIKDITNENPFAVQVLSYLGFETGSDFDYTRALDQKTITLAEASEFVETLLSHSIGFSSAEMEGYDAEKQFLARMLFLNDSTPVSIITFSSVSLVSVINATRGLVEFDAFYTTMQDSTNPYTTKRYANFLSTNFYSSDGSALREAADLTREAMHQVSQIDYDHIYLMNIDLTKEDDVLKIVDDELTVFTGYGTFIMDESTHALTQQASATALIFGAEYNTAFNELLNKIPMNIIKFK